MLGDTAPRISFVFLAEAADCGVAIPELPLTRLPEHGSSRLCKHFALQEVEK